MWLDHYDSCERMRPPFKYMVVGTLKKVPLIVGKHPHDHGRRLERLPGKCSFAAKAGPC